MRRSRLVLTAIGFALLLTGCVRRLPTLRYRLVVEVQTPYGVRTGSSVLEVTTVDQGAGFPGPEAGGVRRGLRGQAVVIGTEPGRYVFALLRKGYLNDYAGSLPVALFRPLVGSGDHPIQPNDDAPRDYLPYDRFHARMLADRHVWDVPRTMPSSDRRIEKELWPDLVRFEDPADPTSVRRVDPGDASIRRVTLQIVDRPVTEGITAILPWLTGSSDRLLVPAHGPPGGGPENAITHGDLFRPKAL